MHVVYRKKLVKKVVKLEKIEVLKITKCIYYASCHRFRRLKNENIRAGTLLYEEIWLVEVRYPLFHQQAYRSMKLEINMDFTCSTLILGS